MLTLTAFKSNIMQLKIKYYIFKNCKWIYSLKKILIFINYILAEDILEIFVYIEDLT